MSSNDTDVNETVDRLLEEADELLEEADDRADLLEDDDLQAVADETRSLFEDAETSELLAAVGIDVTEESSPADLLKALQQADTEPLVRRRRLNLLSEFEGDDAGHEDDRSVLEEFEALGAVLEVGAEADVDPLEGDGVDVDELDLLEDEEDSGLAQHAGALKDAVDDIMERDPDASYQADQAADQETGDAGGGESASDEQAEGDDAEEGSTGYEDSKIAASDRADMRVPLRHSTMPK